MTSPRPRLSRPESLTDQVARNIRNDIEAGVLRDGQVLPSTRDLAEHWGVSVFTITEAMKVLSDEGLVVSKSRSMRVVNAPSQAHEQIRTRMPHVILIGGYAGSGKTLLGRILARETGWPMLDKDSMTRPVVEAALEALGLSPNDRESSKYLSMVRPREYEALMAATEENVECGNSAIVTAPFIREFADVAWIERVKAAYAAMGANLTIAWVHCDAATMQNYIRHRGAARDSAKMADWPTYVSGIDIEFRPSVPHVVIDNSASSVPLQVQAKGLVRVAMGADGAALPGAASPES